MIGCLLKCITFAAVKSKRWNPHVMASSAKGLKLGIFGFLPTTHAKTNTKQMRPRSSHTVRCFTHVYLHAQTAVDEGDIRTRWTTVILIAGKTWRPPIWAPCQDKNGAGSGISPVYLWVTPMFKCNVIANDIRLSILLSFKICNKLLMSEGLTKLICKVPRPNYTDHKSHSYTYLSWLNIFLFHKRSYI